MADQQLIEVTHRGSLDGFEAIVHDSERAALEGDLRRVSSILSLRITARFGVAASTDGEKNGGFAAADGALYTAQREGKNRTVRAGAGIAGILREPVSASEPEG